MKTIISLDEIKKIDNVVFVDCRHFLNNPKLGRMKFDESHIPDSFFMDANQDLSSPEKIEQRKYETSFLKKYFNKIVNIELIQCSLIS